MVTKYPPAIAQGAKSAQTLAAFLSNRRKIREEQEQLELEDWISEQLATLNRPTFA